MGKGRLVQAAPVVFGPTGTIGFTITSLAAGTGWKSAGFDLGANFRRRYALSLKTKFGSAPTAGELLRLAIAWSLDADFYAGGLSAANEALSDVTRFTQLDELAPLYAGADTNVQGIVNEFTARARYGILVALSGTASAALSSTGTDHVITLVALDGPF